MSGKPKILMSWSSGKDSAWALYVLQQKYPGCVAALLTTVNEAADRVAMHAVRRTLLEAQAAAARLPLRTVYIPDPCSNAVYQQRMLVAVESAVREGFTHVAFGDLFLEDVRRYREERLAGTGLEPMFPLWGEPTDRLARTMIAAGLGAKLACVDTRLVEPAFVGREFDEPLLRDLSPSIDPCGERGEFHTCVYAGPMFAYAIPFDVGATLFRDPFIWADLIPAGPDKVGPTASNAGRVLSGAAPFGRYAR